MQRLLLFLFFTTLSSLAIGQSLVTLQGRVTDTQGQPLPNATIYLLNSHAGSTTDASGNYSLQVEQEGKYQIRISRIGYSTISEDVTLSGAQPNEANFILRNEESSLDEVMVTAEKREEESQKVSLSMTTLGAKDIEDFRLWNIQDLTAIAPNFNSSNSGDERNVTFIRGVGNTSYDQAVATYVDGVNQFTLDSYLSQLEDIERIEVLRGPQGTLYGRNAMGGVINIITKQPTDKTEGFAGVDFGNHHLQRYHLGVRTPLIDKKLLLGISGLYNTRDGYYTNEFNGHSFEDQKTYTGNYSLKYIAAPNWDLHLNVRHQINRNKGAFPLSGSVDEAQTHPFRLSQNALATMKDNTLFGSFSVKHAGRSFIFTSETAYQYNRRIYNSPIDGDFSPLDIITIVNDYGGNFNRVNTWTQEFKFSSPASYSGRFQWTAGSYLFIDKQPDKQGTHFGEAAKDIYGLPEANFTTINTTFGDNRGIAFYGQATYSLSSQVELTAGLRYDYEHKKLSGFSEYQPDGQAPFKTLPDTTAKAHYSAFSPKAGITWHLNDDQLIYGTYSRGFRTGGFTELSSDPSEPPLRAFDPEYSNNFEIGLKNDFFEKKLRANLALFYTQVTDMQVPTLILPDAVTVTRNAGKMESKGVELEVTAIPAKGLHVMYNFGYTDAKYTKLDLATNGTSTDLKGKRQIYTPNYTSLAAVQYSFYVNHKKDLQLFVRGEWSAVGKHYFDLPNTVKQRAYSLINSRIGASYKQFELSFWGRNLTDQHYIAYAYDFPPNPAHLGDPRTWGGGLKVKF